MAHGEDAKQVENSGGTSLRYYVVLGVGVLAISLAAIFIRMAHASDVPSLLIAWGRLLIAALILTPLVLRRRDYVAQVQRLSRKDIVLILTSGLFLAMHFSAWVTSLEYTTVLISVVLVTTTPIWVAVMELVFLRAYLARLVLAGLFVGTTGGVLIGLSGGFDPTADPDARLVGALLALIGALTVSVYLILGRRLRATLALTPYIWMVYGVAALIMAGVVLFTGTPVFGYRAEGYLWVLALALAPQLIGHSSLNYALAYLPAAYVSLSTQLEPVFASLIAAVVFSEIPGPLQVTGGAIVIIGVLLASVGQSQQTEDG